MIDFQAAEKKRLEEPASEIGLEPICAMVCNFLLFKLFKLPRSLRRCLYPL